MNKLLNFRRMRRSAQPGFVLTYHRGSANHCPACTKSNWLIGRTTAECAFCGTALPLATSVERGALAIAA